MFFSGIGLAFLVAFILTLVLGKGVKKYAFADLLGFFFVTFLAAWAGGLWIEPSGPAMWGISFTAFIIVGSIVALILAASLPTTRHRTQHPPPTGTDTDKIHQESFFNVFIIITILTLLLAIVYRLAQSWRS